MSRIRLRNCTIRLLDGFRATAAVGAAATPAADDTTLEVDSFAAGTPDDAETIPVGTRFTIEGVEDVYTVTEVTLCDTSGAVNDTPADQNTDLDVDGITGRIPIGTEFTIAGSTLTFTVTGTTESQGGNTTNIEFTPAIATASGVPVEDAVITFEARPVSLTFTPALSEEAGVPEAEDEITILGRALTVKIGDGNITWNETVNYEYQRDRGELDAVVQGDEVPVDVSLDCVYEFLTAATGATIPTPEDVMEQRGEAEDWVSSSTDPCRPYSIDIELEHSPPCDDVDHEIVPFPEFRVERIQHDVNAATLTFSGKCFTTSITPIRRAT